MSIKRLWPTPTGSDARSEGRIGQMRKLVEDGELTREEAEAMIGGSLEPARMKRLWPTPNTLDAMAAKTDKALLKEATEVRPGRSQPSNLRDCVSSSEKWEALQPQRENSPQSTFLQGEMPVEEKYARAVRAYEMGLSIQDLADHYKVTRQTMWKILKRRGCEFRSNLRYGEANHFFRGTLASDKAQNKLEQAIEDGVVVRQTVCQECRKTGKFKNGRQMIQAHHTDYGKPLEVMWLCQKCHHEWHKKYQAKEVIKLESAATQTTSQRGEALTFLRADSRSRANHSLLPGSEAARQTTVFSGQKCSGLLRSSSPLGSLLRTLLVSQRWSSLIVHLKWTAGTTLKTRRQVDVLKWVKCKDGKEEEHWMRCWKTSRKSDTRSHRLSFRLVPSAPHTAGIGCSYWPTVTAADAYLDKMESTQQTEGSRHSVNLSQAVQMWHTPSGQEPGVSVERLVTKEGEPARIGERAYDKETGRLAQVGLTQQVKMYPTPQSRDYRTGEGHRWENTEERSRNLNDAVAHSEGYKLLPTPKTRDWKGQTQRGIHAPGDALPNMDKGDGKPIGGQLNPAFVEFLMNYPKDWTKVD